MKYKEAVDLLGVLTDADDCSLDHHGNCQTHGYSKPCPMPRAKELWQALFEGIRERECVGLELCCDLEAKIEQAKREEFERVEKIIDSFMAHGKYEVVSEEGLAMRCSGADVEYIWNQIKQALKEGK